MNKFKSVSHLMWKVLEDKLKLIWGDAALVIFTEYPKAFLKTKWTCQVKIKVIYSGSKTYLVIVFKINLCIFLDQNLAKFCEVNKSSSIINLVDYFIDLNLWNTFTFSSEGFRPLSLPPLDYAQLFWGHGWGFWLRWRHYCHCQMPWRLPNMHFFPQTKR